MSVMESIRKVLIVDDDSNARSLVKKILRKLDCVELLGASTGEEAILIASKYHPDIVLMDILMPGIDGYETCRRIKSNPLLQSTVIIFMTAVNMDEIDEKIIQVQGDDLLRKPLDASELYFRVKNYLGLVKPKNSHIVDTDCMVPIDCNLCREESSLDMGQGFLYQSEGKYLCKEGRIISLMQQEILLLEELIRFKNRTVPYEQLVKVISVQEESTLGNLRTLIKLLRRKTYKKLITTLPSVGYRLVL